MERLSQIIASKDCGGFIDLALGTSNTDVARLEDLKGFISSVAKEIDSTIQHQARSAVTDGMEDAIVELSNIQFVHPRGRFDMCLFSSGMQLKAKGEIAAATTWSNVSNCLVCPDKDNNIFAFVCKEVVPFKKQKLQLVVFLSKEKEVIQAELSKVWKGQTASPSKDIFHSSADKPFVSCNYGVNQGMLFPMPAGVFFFKPAKFISISEISSLTCGRGGSGQTRYIDLIVEDGLSKEHEFSNITRDDLEPLQRYVQSLLKIREKEQDEPKTDDGAEQKAGEAEDDSEEDGSDFDPEETDEGEGEGPGEEGSGSEEESTSGEEDEDYEDESEGELEKLALDADVEAPSSKRRKFAGASDCKEEQPDNESEARTRRTTCWCATWSPCTRASTSTPCARAAPATGARWWCASSLPRPRSGCTASASSPRWPRPTPSCASWRPSASSSVWRSRTRCRTTGRTRSTGSWTSGRWSPWPRPAGACSGGGRWGGAGTHPSPARPPRGCSRRGWSARPPGGPGCGRPGRPCAGRAGCCRPWPPRATPPPRGGTWRPRGRCTGWTRTRPAPPGTSTAPCCSPASGCRTGTWPLCRRSCWT